MFRNSFSFAPQDYGCLLMSQLGVTTPKSVFNNKRDFECGGTPTVGSLQLVAGRLCFHGKEDVIHGPLCSAPSADAAGGS